MNSKRRKFTFGIYIFLGLVVEEIIFWLFPYTGLGGLICFPTAIFFSLVFGFVIYKLTKTSIKKWMLVSLAVTFLLIQFYLQLRIHPQDFGGSVFEKISIYGEAYRDYGTIQYEMFTELNNAEKVAFYHKFRVMLPTSLTTLGIDTDGNSLEYNPRLYLIENKGNQRFYDTTKLQIVELDTATIIIENPNSMLAKSYRASRNFMDNDGAGYGDETYSLNVQKDYLELDTGIEKVFYFLLNLTK
ncbi:hypothetical protein DXT99_23425 [Pontibacter diazotrophicus]|uniref:Uncharacterized protein n=1 Tax=Pontibacter diazotrophicus TaxID=1400979 RepID=A0A3D8L309_9BACT|nr:hypothetical protein [Pontibacter diazotrophicus]RDV11859.1 hypothetical protein DXT99_23425 [Pontibacter diazotrophicus]